MQDAAWKCLTLDKKCKIIYKIIFRIFLHFWKAQILSIPEKCPKSVCLAKIAKLGGVHQYRYRSKKTPILHLKYAKWSQEQDKATAGGLGFNVEMELK